MGVDTHGAPRFWVSPDTELALLALLAIVGLVGEKSGINARPPVLRCSTSYASGREDSSSSILPPYRVQCNGYGLRSRVVQEIVAAADGDGMYGDPRTRQSDNARTGGTVGGNGGAVRL